MPQSVTFDFLFHAALREKENHFQISWEKKKEKCQAAYPGMLPGFLFVGMNVLSLSFSRVWRSEHTHAQMRLMDGLFYHFFRFVLFIFSPSCTGDASCSRPLVERRSTPKFRSG
jgi:hypothetical protein